jgi:hypothetical protein
MTELDGFIRELQNNILLCKANSRNAETNIGMLAGLMSAGSIVPVSDPDVRVLYQAGYVCGHLLRWLSERGRAVGGPLGLIAAGYAASISDHAGQSALAKPDAPMTAHTYAAIRCERHTGEGLSEADEQLLFGWLVEQTGAPLTPELAATFRRQRARRRERLGFAGSH